MDDVTKEDLKCSWKVIGTTPEQIQLKIRFENPKLISRRGYDDFLLIKGIDRSKFMGANSK